MPIAQSQSVVRRFGNDDNFIYGFYNSSGFPQYPGDPASPGGMFFYGVLGGSPGIPVQNPHSLGNE